MASNSVSVTALFVAAFALANPARADSDSARAEELIRQANALRQKGQDPAALPLYQQAYNVARSPRTAAQLGLVELSLGYWLESDEHLSEAVAATSHPWVNRNRTILEEAHTNASSHVGTLTIEGQPVGAEVLVNSHGVGSFPLGGPVRVSEGNATVEVRAAEHTSQTRTVKVRGASGQRLRFELAPLSVAQQQPVVPLSVAVSAPPPPPLHKELPPWRRVLPWGLVIGTAIAGGIAIWQHISWRSTQTEFDAIDACGTTRPKRGSDSRCEGLYQKLSTGQTRAYVAYGVAGAFGIGAAVSFIFNSAAIKSGELAVGSGPTPLALSYRGRF